MRVLASPSLAAVPFDYLHHLVTVPVTINGSIESRFVLDSGIGLTLVSASLADTAGCEPTGVTFSGRRMFQRIIYDGLVGDDFLRRFAVTFDVAGGRMIFGD